MRNYLGWGLACLLGLTGGHCRAQDPDGELRGRVEAGLAEAVDYFAHRVGASGGYLWRYRADLSVGEGEGPASRTMFWVQPPGTPAVGMAYLTAYEATGNREYLAAARDAARALAQGQLRSGGWDYSVELDPARRAGIAYRLGTEPKGKARNVSTLDDETTQSALGLLMRVDHALEQQDREIHESAIYAIERLLAVQYPNGAWPQRFDGPPDASEHPDVPVSYPETWSRTFEKRDYRGDYTLNDGAVEDMVETMLDAHAVYGREDCREAAKRAGRFLLRARMPEPQPAWAQQYDAKMQPSWARKFEPPAVTGGESQGAIRTLLTLARETGDAAFLEPVPGALAYLERSRLPDGQLARFYELRTNRPLYFTREYELTYSDADLPTHYAFKVVDMTPRLRASHEDVVEGMAKGARPRPVPALGKVKWGRSLEEQARKAVETLDDEGRWVTQGRLRTVEGDEEGPILESSTFVRNVTAMARYLAATKGSPSK